MASGIRATVAFSPAAGCPIVERPLDDTTVEAAASSVGSTERAHSVTDFTVTGELETDGSVSALFDGGPANWYRLERDEGVDCPCRCLGELGIPVTRYVADGEALTLAFHAVDYEELRDVVAALRERFPDVDIKRFVRSPDGGQPRDGVLVDRNKLTARQLEVAATALEMGYFERPREANATAVAEALDINPSTFSEHLRAAQGKVFGDLLETER